MPDLSTFQNPVYSGSFPDPYVLKFRGVYYAYCTGFWTDGKVFGVLKSYDLVNWHEAGGAMTPLVEDPPFYWAPEVTYSDGVFYLYYSAGNEAQMELRVATSKFPERDFVDAGQKLTLQEFAIDAHVYTDDDGKRYLFYATDFLEHTHIGTGTVIDELTKWHTPAGRPRPVTRARYDWQVYDPARREKNGVRWHTVEGPFVLKRKGVYYEMFSGGNWQNVSYGVSFATADDIGRAGEWDQFSDGEKVLPILRTVPDRVIGPGHNSVVRGPDNRELYCVYHRWVDGQRVLAIDRMDFAGGRIFIAGATDTPQLRPFAPAFIDRFDGMELSARWRRTGNWYLDNSAVIGEAAGENVLMFDGPGNSFICEFDVRFSGEFQETSQCGFCLWQGERQIFDFKILPDKSGIRLARFDGHAPDEQFIGMPGLSGDAFHAVSVETDDGWLKLSLNGVPLPAEVSLTGGVDGLSLYAKDLKTAFSAFTLTRGFAELFDRTPAEKTGARWQRGNDNGRCRIADKQLFLTPAEDREGRLNAGEANENYEFAANIRLDTATGNITGDDWEFGIVLLNEGGEVISRLSISPGRSGPANFNLDGKSVGAGQAAAYRQFRFTLIDGVLSFDAEGRPLAQLTVTKEKMRPAIFYRQCAVALDMVRQTIL